MSKVAIARALRRILERPELMELEPFYPETCAVLRVVTSQH